MHKSDRRRSKFRGNPFNPLNHLHRHQDAEVVLVLGRADDAGAQRFRHLQVQAGAVEDAEHVDQVLGVEWDATPREGFMADCLSPMRLASHITHQACRSKSRRPA